MHGCRDLDDTEPSRRDPHKSQTATWTADEGKSPFFLSGEYDEAILSMIRQGRQNNVLPEGVVPRFVAVVSRRGWQGIAKKNMKWSALQENYHIWTPPLKKNI